MPAYAYGATQDAQDQIDNLPLAALPHYAELITFLEFTPWEGDSANRAKPDGCSSLLLSEWLSWVFVVWAIRPCLGCLPWVRAVVAMGSLLEELARREAAARRRIEGLREQIAELTERLGSEEDRLSRLVITRETVEEILGEAARLVEDPAGGDEPGEAADREPQAVDETLRLGVTTVPRWRPGMGTKVLPQAYRDAVEILVDAGEPMRAGQVLAAMGLPDSASKREGLRSKLKRLVERGWLEGAEAGLFTVREQVAAQVSGHASAAGTASGGIGSSPPG